MKTIGLLGGMTWESTVTYYQIVNETIKENLGGFHSAKCILYSVDFDEIEKCQTDSDWDKSAEILSSAAKSLEKAGADFLVICTNTMHKIAEKIQNNIGIPILHIADLTAEELISMNIKKVGLLGTKYTMEQDFYIDRLKSKGIEVIVPDAEERQIIHSVIYEELSMGIIDPNSKQNYISIIESLSKRGAQGIILGCTEIGLLIKQDDTSIPLFDTARIHAMKSAEYALIK